MTEDTWVGQTLAGKYRVEEVLGKGGMGLVLGARHIKLDEPVAIKLLRPAMMEIDGMVARFLREARAASKIKSEHVVRVTDVDVLPDGAPYMVMERLSGTDLYDLRAARGALGVAEAVGHVLQACDAIAEAHALGIVHRDLKPSNLFLHRLTDGREIVKVLDFGLSKVEAPGEMEHTRSGQVLGSPKYMSPEQMLSMHDVDGRADIWSLGVILYELVAGQPPFAGDTTPRLCAQVLNADPAPPSTLRPDLPPGLEPILLRCLEKERAARYPNLGELVAALIPFGPRDAVIRRTATHPKILPAPSSSRLRSVTPEPVTVGPASRPKPHAALAGNAPPNPVTEDQPTTLLDREGTGGAKRPTPEAPSAGSSAERPPRRARIVAAVGAAALVGALGVLAVTRGGHGAGAPEATPGATPPAAGSAVPAAASPPSRSDAPVPAATASQEKRALNPDELPDVAPTAASSTAPKVAGGGPGTQAKKAKPETKPEPSSDPFGGRRR